MADAGDHGQCEFCRWHNTEDWERGLGLKGPRRLDRAPFLSNRQGSRAAALPHMDHGRLGGRRAGVPKIDRRNAALEYNARPVPWKIQECSLGRVGRCRRVRRRPAPVTDIQSERSSSAQKHQGHHHSAAAAAHTPSRVTTPASSSGVTPELHRLTNARLCRMPYWSSSPQASCHAVIIPWFGAGGDGGASFACTVGGDGRPVRQLPLPSPLPPPLCFFEIDHTHTDPSPGRGG